MITTRPKRELTRLKLVQTLNILLPENVETEAKMVKIEYYKTNKHKLIIYWILSILSIGLIPALCYWRHSIRVLFKYIQTSSDDSEFLLIYGLDKSIEHVKVTTRDLYLNGNYKRSRSFTYRLYSYYFDEKEKLFKPIEYSLKGKSYKSIHEDFGNGIPSLEEYKDQLITFGFNSTDIPIKSSWRIIFDEIFSPFYLFQLYAILIWTLYIDYEIYAFIILSLSIITLSISSFKTRKNLKKLQQKVHYQTEILAYRPNSEGITSVPTVVSSKDLVPGDLIAIPTGKKMPCDVLLLSGMCTMKESMLTGDSMLVTKHALPHTDEVFDHWTAHQHILFSGTECLEVMKGNSEPQVVGLVIRTGFWTMKARLIRSYLYLKEDSLEVHKDALKFFSLIGVISILLSMMCVKTFVEQEVSAEFVFSKVMDIITIAVPTVIPTCALIGFFISSLKLKRSSISSKSEVKVDLAGKVDLVCFDKTGTLTEDSLDLHGVRLVGQTSSQQSKFLPIVKDEIYKTLSRENKNSPSHLLLDLMSTCHNLSYINGQLSGDPFDVKMFKGVEWPVSPFMSASRSPNDYSRSSMSFAFDHVLNVSETTRLTGSDLTLIRRFDSTPKLQRISVICQSESEHCQRINVKGKPEAVSKICLPETVPSDLDEVVSHYEQCGYKVIGCASQVLKRKVRVSDNLAREYFERDLEFLGLLVFENRLKEVTRSVILNLANASIPSIMLAEDNPRNSIYTAKLCGILDTQQKIILGTLERSKITTILGDSQVFELDKESVKFSLINEQLQADPDRSLNQPIDEEPNFPNDPTEITQFIKNEDNIALILTGEAFNHLSSTLNLDTELYTQILKKTRVYTEMYPEDKARVIEELQKQGSIVAMCGDGTNDCPALKVAKSSIALSEEEASLAALFTSKVMNVSSLEVLLREGRCSIVTSVQRYKYIALYILIQVMGVVILYLNLAGLSNNAFLYQDVIIILPTTILISLTPASNKLAKDKPVSQLMSPHVLLSVLGQGFIQGLTMGISVVILRNQEWYLSPEAIRVQEELDNLDWTAPNYDATMLFLISNVQFVSLLLAFSVGKPFRQPFYRNWIVLIWVIGATVMNYLLILGQSPSVIEFFEILDFKEDHGFRWIIFAITVVNSFLTLAYEKLFLPRIISRLFKSQKKTKYSK